MAAVLAVALFGGSYTYNTALACSYVSLDVDQSSVEFAINRRGRVIGVRAISSDTKELADTLTETVRNQTVDDALDQAMDTLQEEGYLEEDDAIIASVTSDTARRGSELSQAVARTVENHKTSGVKLYMM